MQAYFQLFRTWKPRKTEICTPWKLCSKRPDSWLSSGRVDPA